MQTSASEGYLSTFLTLNMEVKVKRDINCLKLHVSF